jgi:hypothetical protein
MEGFLPSHMATERSRGLKVGEGAVSLVVRRTPEGTSIGVIERRGHLTVEVLK